MPITSAHERPQPQTAAAAFSDAVTFALGDPAADVYAVARVGLSSAEDGTPHGSGLAVVFAGKEPVCVRAAGGLPLAQAAFEAVDAAGVRTTVVEPLQEWTLAVTSEDGTVALELVFTALSEPGALAPGSPVAKAGGMEGYEQLCRVTGTARVRGGTRTVDCLGQRGHSWGAPDWDRIVLARTVSAWAGDDLAVALTSVRGHKAKSHADEALHTSVFALPRGAEAADGAGLLAIAPDESRLSTTYDAEGRQRRAGLEIYEDSEGYPRRGAGEVVCGTSLDLGRLRLDCSFFHWRLDGREGVGRYDILRRVEAGGVSATAGPITTVISDYGGVLTSPLMGAFVKINERHGFPDTALNVAMMTAGEARGTNLLFDLECGRIAEAEFLEILGAQLSHDLGREVDLSRFSEHYFAGLSVNEPMVAALAEARAAGYRMGLLTNNVVEWGPRWRPTIPVDELFDDVVDSAYVGMRKPDPAIYVLACERLGVAPAECVFVDDFAHNCEAAQALGMTTVWLRETPAAVAELRAVLAERGAPGTAGPLPAAATTVAGG